MRIGSFRKNLNRTMPQGPARKGGVGIEAHEQTRNRATNLRPNQSPHLRIRGGHEGKQIPARLPD